MKNKQKLKINIRLQELYLTWKPLKKAMHVMPNHFSLAWHVSGFPIPQVKDFTALG